MRGAAESQSQSHADADAERHGGRALHPPQASPEKTNLHIKIPKDDVLLKQEKQKRVLSTFEEQEIEHLRATKLHAVEIEAADSSSEQPAELLMLRHGSAASAAKPRDPEPTATPNGLPGEGHDAGHDAGGESAGLAFAATRRQWLLVERQASQTERRAAAPLSPRRTAGDRDAGGGGGGGGGPPPGWNGPSVSPGRDGKSSSLSRSDDGDEDDDDGDSGYRFPDSPDDATLADGGSVDLGPDGGGASTGDSAASPGSPRSPRSTPPETPIEREIRQSLRREESLRRRRGMAGVACGPGSLTELVEIKTLPALSSRLALPRSPHPLAAPYPSHGRFRLAEQQMYRDIRLETQREEVLVRAGHVRGQYDRGAAQELGLLKKIFEQPEPPLSPTTPKARQPSTSSPGPVRQSSRERLLLEPASENVVIVEHNVLQPQGRTGAPLTSTPHRATRSLEWDTGNVIILESRIGAWDEEPAMSTPPEPPTSPPGGEPSPFGPSLRRANDALSLVEREIREAHRRDDELRRQRHGVYGTAGTPGGLPQGGLPLNPAAGDRAPRATGGATPAVPAAESKAITNGQDNQHPAQHRDPSPGSKSDSAQVSPGGRRSPRKSAMALRWEAGIFANHQDSLN